MDLKKQCQRSSPSWKSSLALTAFKTYKIHASCASQPNQLRKLSWKVFRESCSKGRCRIGHVSRTKTLLMTYHCIIATLHLPRAPTSSRPATGLEQLSRPSPSWPPELWANSYRWIYLNLFFFKLYIGLFGTTYVRWGTETNRCPGHTHKMLLKPSHIHVLFIHRVMQILLQGIGHLTACLELSRDSRHRLGDDQGRTGLINENGILSPSRKMGVTRSSHLWL